MHATTDFSPRRRCRRTGHREAREPTSHPSAPGGDWADLGIYLREIARTPLLTRQEEVDLARRIELADAAALQLAADEGALPADERRSLAALAADGREAAEAFARANLRLVVGLAARYRGRGLGLPDLIQEGNLGLLTAVRKFAWRRGHRFSTYATWWIRQALDRAVADQSRTVRLPVHMHDAVRRLHRRRAALHAALGREPRPDELASALGVAEGALGRIIAADRRMLSLDAPREGAEGDWGSLGELLVDEAIPDPALASEGHALAGDVAHALRCLDERSAHVVRRRFGLGCGAPATLAEAGDELGLSRERVRQIELAAIERLRCPAIRARLESYRDVR
jgi:RNA polymerase primary sigma factor